MSSIQRYIAEDYYLRPNNGPVGADDLVLYADHVAAVEAAEQAIFALHAEWTVTGMCEPGCLACKRLDELYAERRAGYEEGQNETQEHIGNPVSYAVGREQAIRDCLAAVEALNAWNEPARLFKSYAVATLRALLPKEKS